MDQNGQRITPRAQRLCDNCDHSRMWPGGELHCHANIPQAVAVGAVVQQPVLQGMPAKPVPIVMGVFPPCPPGWGCDHWAERQPDHPDLHHPAPVPEPTHPGSVHRQ